MEKMFTKDFIKFLGGFTAMLAVALVLVFVMQAQVEPETQRAGTQTLPATTTGQ